MSLKRIVTRGVCAALLIGSPLAVAATASASNGVTQVRGTLTPDTAGVCQRALPFEAAFVVTGTLTGCWFVDHTTVLHTNHAGGFVAKGTDEFNGCVTGTTRCGSFFTNFKRTARYIGSVEKHGRSHHAVDETRGTEGFVGVDGIINMHDLANGNRNYKGHLRLSA
jgi:hypothetical protein